MIKNMRIWPFGRLSFIQCTLAVSFILVIYSIAQLRQIRNPLARSRLYDAPHSVAQEPDYYKWETKSYFNPVRLEVNTKTKAERLCQTFPTHLLTSIQPVLKVGHGDRKESVDAQLQSVSACIPDLLIFSDLNETIGDGKHVTYDVLADLPASYEDFNKDFKHYRLMKEMQASGTLDVDKELTASIDGQKIDRFKFLPMVERAWAMRPDKKWFVFYETDTYVVWDNMFRFLENFDPETPLYMGNPSRGSDDGETETWFASGGSGFVLSRAAVKKLVARKEDSNGIYTEPSLSMRWMDLSKVDPRGDSVLGWALHNVGITLHGFYPMFSPHSIESRPFTDKDWCAPVLTFHGAGPEKMVEFWRWEHTRRQFERPLLAQEFYDFERPGDPFITEGWDNGASDPGPEVTSSELCADACAVEPTCLQWTWDEKSCKFGTKLQNGSKQKPDKNGKDAKTKIVSGWYTIKIKSLRKKRQCVLAEWAKPSTSRIIQANTSKIEG